MFVSQSKKIFIPAKRWNYGLSCANFPTQIHDLPLKIAEIG